MPFVSVVFFLFGQRRGPESIVKLLLRDHESWQGYRCPSLATGNLYFFLVFFPFCSIGSFTQELMSLTQCDLIANVCSNAPLSICHSKGTEEWLMGDGMLEILPLVFGVVAEVLRREDAIEQRTAWKASASSASSAVTHDPATAAHRKDVHDWIVNNYKSLMNAMENKEMKNKIETVKYLLMWVQSALEVFDRDKVRQRSVLSNEKKTVFRFLEAFKFCLWL